jgi:iron complex transport system permease protein
MTFATASLLVGAAIALAGPIGFVGLMVPHASRALVGPDHRALMPCAMLGGAALLILCDTVARVALAPSELPVGVVTALLGGPFFLYLLLREKTRGRLWGG